MTQPTAQSIEELTQRAIAELAGFETTEQLDQWRVAYLGRRGELTAILRGLSQLDLEDRRQIGALGNQAKSTLEDKPILMRKVSLNVIAGIFGDLWGDLGEDAEKN